MKTGDLDRRAQFHRALKADNGLETVVTWPAHGDPVWVKRRDMTDIEKERAGQVIASASARFTLRYSSFTAAITPKDRIVCEGVDYGITGSRELGRREWLEITATAQVDL